MRKLNMKHRLGLVLTTLWLLAYPTWKSLTYVNVVNGLMEEEYRICVRENLKMDCSMHLSNFVKEPEFWSHWEGEFLGAVILALLAWVCIGAIYFTSRWILAGRAANSN